MKNRILFITALLLIFSAGCQKELLIPEESEQTNAIDAIRARHTVQEVNFFDYTFVSRNNAHIKTGGLIDFRDDSVAQFINAVMDKVLLDNAEHQFVAQLTSRIGYPVWNRSMILSEQHEGHMVAIVPFAQLDDTAVRAYIMAYKPDDNWRITLAEKDTLIQILQQEAATVNTDSKLFFAINFLWLDELLFGRADSQIDNWVLDRADDPPGITDNERIETRCTWWAVVIRRCIESPRPMAITDNDIET